MIAENLTVAHWPHRPPLPAPGEPVLLRVSTAGPRAAARQQLRAATRTVLAAWSDLPLSAIFLRETAHGPVFPTALRGHPVAFSFSYTATAAWVALALDSPVGVDALLVQPFPEMESVARLYLGPAALAEIESSPNPAHPIARHWTALEARQTLSHRPLCEHPSLLADRPTLREYSLDDGATVVTLVLAPPPP